LAIVTIVEGLFNLLMMGFLTCDWRANLLFSEWMINQEDKYKIKELNKWPI
jgi:hypothetical protein